MLKLHVLAMTGETKHWARHLFSSGGYGQTIIVQFLPPGAVPSSCLCCTLVRSQMPCRPTQCLASFWVSNASRLPHKSPVGFFHLVPKKALIRSDEFAFVMVDDILNRGKLPEA